MKKLLILPLLLIISTACGSKTTVGGTVVSDNERVVGADVLIIDKSEFDKTVAARKTEENKLLSEIEGKNNCFGTGSEFLRDECLQDLKRLKYDLQKFYFFPPPIYFLKTSTDADGKFSFSLPKKSAFVIMVSAKDSAWILPIEADGKEQNLTLGNHNAQRF